MSSQNFNDDVNPLTSRTNSNSGGGPQPFNREGGPESKSWEWNIYVVPLQPGETATCHVMLGVDDNGSLKVDGKGVDIPGEGQYHGGQYREKTNSFEISPGYHKVSMTYENVALPPDWKNLAILAYSVEVEVSGSGSSSSYQPDEDDPDPIDTDDDGEDTPCECSSSTSPSSSSDSQSSSSNPCPDNDNGEGENGEDPQEEPCACEENAGGSSSNTPARRGEEAARTAVLASRHSSAGKRVTAQTRKAEMIWRTNFGSFRGMTGLPQGLLEIVGRTYSPELCTPRALHYWHPMATAITAAPPAGIGADTAFQLQSGGTKINYFSYAAGSGGSAGSSSVGPIAGSAKRGGSASFRETVGSARGIGDFSLSVRSNAGHTVSYSAGASSSLKNATGYTAKNGASYTKEDFDGKLDIVRAADGSIRQIWNLWDGLASIEDITASGYRIALYLPEQVGEKNTTTGLYPVTGDPFKTFAISGDAATNKLTVTEQTAGRAPYATRYWQGADGAWNMAQGEGEDAVYTLKEKQVISPDAWKLITTIQRGENGAPISRVCETYAVTRNGNLCTSRIEGYGTAYARETTYEYNGMGKVAKETAPDGSIKTWSYDQFGREVVSSVPWAGGGDKATYTTYRDNTQADPDILNQRATLTATAADLWQTACTYTEADHVRRVEKRTTALGAEGERLEVKETWLGTAPNVHARGRLKMTQGTDGVQTHYAYEPTDQYGALYRVTAETRVAGEPVPGHSTRKVTYVSEQGNNMRYEQYALLTDGTWAMTDASTYEYDAENRWTKRTRANGRVYERAMMCCGPLWEKDEDGVLTTYSYNTARQLVEAIRSEVADGATVVTPEMIISYTRDALGKITALRKDTGPMTVTESRAYDLLGRLTSETDVLGRETTHAYSEDGLTETVTTPTGATLITQKHPDGTVLRRSGTGQRDISTVSDVVADGVRLTQTAHDAGGGAVILNRTIVNGLGQTIRTAVPQASGSGFIYENMTYNALNLLVKRQVTSMAPVLYDYDDFGNLVKTTLKLAEAPTPANSRVTEYAYSREQRADGVYRIIAITSYTAEGTPVVHKQATLLSSTSGTLASKSIATDPRNHDIVEWTEYGGASLRLQKKTVPGVERAALTRIVDGFTTAVTGFDGATASQMRAYTAAGITHTVTDTRGNVTTRTHDVIGRILTDTDAAGNTTAYAYGQPVDLPTCVTNALGNTSCAAYDLRGRKEAEWGTAIQPAVYAYDDADRIVALTTFRDPAATITTDPRERTDGDTTTWAYHAAAGLVLRKTYADATHVDTTYDALNRVATTTNARGTVATYAYVPFTGELTGISYDDNGATPAITSQYNHLGQLTQIADASGTRSFTYNQYNEQESETTAGLAASVLTTSRDHLGRTSGYSLVYGETTALQTAWSFDPSGRLSTVSLNAVAKPFTYGYNAENGLLDTLDYPNTLKRWYTREEKRDLPVKIDYLRPYAANYPAKTDYAYDELGRPTTKKDFFNAPTPDLTHAYSYNDRNELIADAMSRGDTYNYDYDNIGNRKTAQEGTDVPATAYTTNRLNQYTEITEGTETPFVPTYDADGNQTKLQTSTGEWTVAYNALNQATCFTQGGKRVECRYDYLNRRVEKTVYEGETLMSKKRYLYGEYLQIAELDAMNASETVQPVLRKTYLWDPMEPIATRILAMSVFDETGAYVEDLYFTHDALKNTTALFGIQAGRRALYEYGPYGSTVKMEGNAVEVNPFRFSSEYFDEETGLVQYNFRFYNPTEGRWTSRDPIGESYSISLYSFSENNASMFFDILGLKRVSYTIDDFGVWCCSDKIKNITKYVLKPFTKGHTVGHAFISCPIAGTRGKYPKGNSLISGGDIRDDSSLLDQYKDTDRLIKRDYRACPESYQKMAKMIQAEEKHPGTYVLAGAQCEDWVDELLKKTDSRKPSKDDPIKQGGLFHLPGSPKHDPRNNPPWGNDIPIFSGGFEF